MFTNPTINLQITMNSLNKVINQIKNIPDKTAFDDVIEIIDEFYRYTPTRFYNGADKNIIINASGENTGSCKIFTFARLNDLDKDQTLNCFGKYYREDVLMHPEGSNHANIRAFIKHGPDNINFDNDALQLKK